MKKTTKKIMGAALGLLAAFTVSSTALASQTKIADVSQYQGTINWKKASKEIQLAIIRVQHGNTGDADFRIDTQKDINANGAYKNGVPFGQYDYTEFSSVADAKKEAKDFYKRTNSHAKFFVLDNEHRKGKGSEQSYVNAWYSTMRKLTKKPLIYYTYESFVNQYKINFSKFDGSWIANYSNKPSTVKADLWQYTSKGRIGGITANTVDLSKALNSSVVKSWYTTNTKASYYKSVPASKTIKTTHSINEYKTANLTGKLAAVKAGKTLKVTKIARSSHGAYRFQLSNGRYISANKEFLTAQ
ncbi:GH25 family lysozyme [Lentilactobacillus senioris]|uniref:GH25 family lysozyme n=1 Tax=Lentilactobacillus senioris TaxID=931534 RepID=UPI0022815F88|nr:GH25 family lysozyme [Lentilactobacillus senioris]MCY9806395.1 GH25 family lysozyme [Lentilactobacillus senioris]